MTCVIAPTCSPRLPSEVIDSVARSIACLMFCIVRAVSYTTLDPFCADWRITSPRSFVSLIETSMRCVDSSIDAAARAVSSDSAARPSVFAATAWIDDVIASMERAISSTAPASPSAWSDTSSIECATWAADCDVACASSDSAPMLPSASRSAWLICDIDVVVLAMDAPSSLTLCDRPFVPRCTSAATISIEPAALRNPNTTRRN